MYVDCHIKMEEVKTLQLNIYKDPLQEARLFGDSVLYTAQPIPREDVPDGWYCYDLRGTARSPHEPYALVDEAGENHAGSVLSPLPLKNAAAQKRLLKDGFQLTGERLSLADFCYQQQIQFPRPPIRFMFRPASPEESGYFYAQPPEKDADMGPSATSESTSGAAVTSSGIPGGRGVPRN